MWHESTSCGHESAKIASIAVPYLQGRGVDCGCGMSPVWPSAIGIDNGHHFGDRSAGIRSDATDLSLFADGSLDYVFSSHVLEHIPVSKVLPTLKEWWRALKVGGRLVLYLPHKDFYPNVGQPGANPDHKADYRPDDIIEVMQKVGSWTMLENEERNGSNEYSFFQVFRKEEAPDLHAFNIWQRNPGGQKRAFVCRFGAIGDQIVAASILPGLKKQGYHVTYMTTPDAHQIVLHDPNIDEFWVQAKDFVPNHELGSFFDSVEERCDLFVNLCESIEGSLLQIPGRLQHKYTDETRRKLFGTVNYLEKTHDIAAVPHDFAPRFYPTEAEHRWARAVRRRMDGPVVAWAVSGSSLHKIYPWVDIVSGWLLKNTGAHVVLMGDKTQGVELQTAIAGCIAPELKARLHLNCGLWDIRKSLSFVQVADVVVGPETGLLNGVCIEDNAKVIYLSHSSPENLTKHWKNTTTLVPERSRAPCAPCLRLHFDWTHCHQSKATKAAACASAIAPEHVYEAILKSIPGWDVT